MSKRSDKRAQRQSARRDKQRARLVKQKEHSSDNKEPRHRDTDWNKSPIRFVFSVFDHQWRWGMAGEQEYCVIAICKYLKELGGNTWGDLQKTRSKNHAIPVEKLCVEAKKRLVEIKQEDTDTLWELHITQTHRIFGIKDRDAFKVLWWDPKHNVYPMDITNNAGGPTRAVCGRHNQP